MKAKADETASGLGVWPSGIGVQGVVVLKAYQQVKRNGQAAVVDGQSLDDFNTILENDLYKLWN